MNFLVNAVFFTSISSFSPITTFFKTRQGVNYFAHCWIVPERVCGLPLIVLTETMCCRHRNDMHIHTHTLYRGVAPSFYDRVSQCQCQHDDRVTVPPHVSVNTNPLARPFYSPGHSWPCLLTTLLLVISMRLDTVDTRTYSTLTSCSRKFENVHPRILW